MWRRSQRPVGTFAVQVKCVFDASLQLCACVMDDGFEFVLSQRPNICTENVEMYASCLIS